MHLVELAAYVVVLLVLIPKWGLLGAALAWTLRCAADSATLFVLVRASILKRSVEFTPAQLGAMALILLALIGALVPSSLEQRILYLAAASAMFSALGWMVLLDPSERARARDPRSLLLRPPR
jgi:O-antigen/teichoic acid export membrane protein